MRTVRQAIIKKAIIHKLDNSVERPVLSDFELELNDSLREFITTHVIKSLHDEKIRAAKFDDGRNIVKESCTYIFEDNDTFVVRTKEIAIELFNAMHGNRNISSADIIICLYEGNNTDYLALLKMDYQNNHMSKIETVEGLTKVTIIDNGISLPNIRQKLQKCIFIQNYCRENVYDLMLLDKQTRVETLNDVARYFAHTFLRCTLAINDLTNTRSFHKLVSKWVDSEIDSVDEQKRILDSLRSSLLNQPVINITQFASGLFEEEEKQHSLMNFLSNAGLVDLEFSPDENWVSTRLRTRTIKTSDGIEVNLTEEDYNNDDKFSIFPSEQEGKHNITIKNVRITKWG